MANYGIKIAELRKQKNLTQAELGAELNISAQAVSKWENGLSEPDINSLKKLSSLFGVSIDELLSPPKPVEKPAEPTLDELRGGTLPDYLKSDTKEEAKFESAVTETTIEPAPVVEQKIINGYCEKCKKPVGPGEYELTHNRFTGSSSFAKSTVQHIYCKDCYNKLADLITAEKKRARAREQAQKEAEKRQEIIDNQRFFWKGMGWGLVILIIGLISALTSGFIAKSAGQTFFSTFIKPFIGAFFLASFISQLIWGGWLRDFVKKAKDYSWKAPGLIWTLDFDGFIWLILMKIIFGILGLLLSVIVFVGGLFIAFSISLFSFPFAFYKALKGKTLEAYQ